MRARNERATAPALVLAIFAITIAVLAVVTMPGCGAPAQAEAAPDFYRDAILAELAIATLDAPDTPTPAPDDGRPKPGGVCSNCNGTGRTGDGITTCFVCDGTGREPGNSTQAEPETILLKPPAELVLMPDAPELPADEADDEIAMAFPFGGGQVCGPNGCGPAATTRSAPRAASGGGATYTAQPVRTVARRIVRPLRIFRIFRRR